MTRKLKKHGLGGPRNKRSTENPRGVATSGKVGKGSPPKEFRWKPGESGNPSGLPSKRRLVTVEAITAALGRIDPKTGKSDLETIVDHSIRLAKQGSHFDKKLLLNYALGMPKQSVDLDAVNYTDALSRMRQKRELNEADATIRKYFHELPATTPANGHTDAATALLASRLPDQDLSTAREDDAEQPAVATQPKQKIQVEL